MYAFTPEKTPSLVGQFFGLAILYVFGNLSFLIGLLKSGTAVLPGFRLIFAMVYFPKQIDHFGIQYVALKVAENFQRFDL